MTSNEEALRVVREAVNELLKRAQAALTFSTESADIKRACDDLRELLRAWDLLDDSVRSSVGGVLQIVRNNCKHPDAKRGYNERDGDWMSPCPVCGESE